MAARTTVEDEHPPYFAAVPPLAWMAGVATLADLLINRVLIRLGSDSWSESELGRLDGWGVFARNLGVVSSLVALSFCLVALSSRKSALPLSARASIASFGWVLIPIVAWMTFLPLGRTGWEWVLVEAGLAHALILLLVLAGLHWRSSHSTSAALVLTLIAALSALLSTVVTSIGGRTYWEHTERLSNAFRWSGELTYLAVPLVLCFAVATPIREARGKLAVSLAALAAGLVTAGLALWRHVVGPDMPDLLYGALGLELLQGHAFMFYSIPLGIGWAVTVAAIVSKNPASRETGAALLLLLSVGYAPRTPSTLFTAVLGVALLTRASIALARDRLKTRN